jgi:hypothetical protein
MYMMIVDIMQKRRDENRREEDTLQVLMDSGKSDAEVLLVFSGVFPCALVPRANHTSYRLGMDTRWSK